MDEYNIVAMTLATTILSVVFDAQTEDMVILIDKLLDDFDIGFSRFDFPDFDNFRSKD